MKINTLTILTVVTLGTACSLAAQKPHPPALSKLPAAQEVTVTPAAGTQLLYQFLATGAQTYACKAGVLSTTSIPKAVLADADPTSHLTINHDEPVEKMARWTMVDASGKTVAAIQTDKTKAKRFPAPDGISIAWLRLDPVKGEGSGRFQNVTSIQRLYTGGGNPAGTTCTTDEAVPYTAHYYFWGTPAKPAY